MRALLAVCSIVPLVLAPGRVAGQNACEDVLVTDCPAPRDPGAGRYFYVRFTEGSSPRHKENARAHLTLNGSVKVDLVRYEVADGATASCWRGRLPADTQSAPLAAWATGAQYHRCEVVDLTIHQSHQTALRIRMRARAEVLRNPTSGEPLRLSTLPVAPATRAAHIAALLEEAWAYVQDGGDQTAVEDVWSSLDAPAGSAVLALLRGRAGASCDADCFSHDRITSLPYATVWLVPHRDEAQLQADWSRIRFALGRVESPEATRAAALLRDPMFVAELPPPDAAADAWTAARLEAPPRDRRRLDLVRDVASGL